MPHHDDLAAFGGPPALPPSVRPSRWPRISEDEAQRVAAVLHSEPILGSDSPQLLRLEEAWCRYVEVPHCRAVGSGTAGLHLALWSAGVGPGDDVIVPAYSFMASVQAVLHAGAAPVFADVDRHSYTIDPERIETVITPQTKAIIVVHLAGLPADMDPIMAISQRHGIAVVEDCAHAHGATYKGKKTGSLGDAASFSINGVKNMAAGEAGLFTTRHRSYHERAEGLYLRVTLGADREHEKYPLASLGYNYRCSVVAAALAREQLLRLDEMNAHRRSNCRRLSEQLEAIPGVHPPHVPAGRTHVYHMYRVHYEPTAVGVETDPLEFRAKVVAALAAEGVLCRSWMNWTLPELPIFAEPGDFEASYPWRRTWDRDRVYRADAYPEARRMVDQTSVVADAPTAEGPEVIDLMAEGFRKVFSRIDQVMDLRLSDELRSGELAHCDAIRQALLAANQ